LSKKSEFIQSSASTSAFMTDFAVKEVCLSGIGENQGIDQSSFIWNHWKNEHRFGDCLFDGSMPEGSVYAEFEAKSGIPIILFRLALMIFSGLNTDRDRLWLEEFFLTIEDGANLSQVWPRFAHWLLIDPRLGAIKYARSAKSRTAIENVARLFREGCGDHNQWRKAHAGARCMPDDDDTVAAVSAASSIAATAYLAVAENVTEDAVTLAVVAAVRSIAGAAACSASAGAAYISMSEKLLELIKEAA
jgi:hypothetical protein